ncbi:MAG: hypothetical protein Q9182_000143 [Xanthomendoza sp. 2 TL-2023]
MAPADHALPPHYLHQKTPCSNSEPDGSSEVNTFPNGHLSTLETIITTHQPVLESLLLQLPTSAILDLYHASRYLRSFLRKCPTAWSALSFRRLPATRTTERHPSPASDSSSELSTAQSKPYALDQLLISVVLPFGTCMRCLDLDQTAVSGHTLTSSILPARRETLQHLSIRGCKNVSLKYHILPYLNLFKLQQSIDVSGARKRTDHLALRSLYTFRCRHHRRRPYLASSLLRRDSDSEPTHELIKICRSLDIWTDTGWCPTPGGRCFRRKDYFAGRGMNDAQNEVWVVFDRLWRSGNRIGPLETQSQWPVRRRGQLWQDDEYGYGGEALGTGNGSSTRHGKLTPTHLRESHRRPLPRLKAVSAGAASADEGERSHESLWWAPNARRSPNSMDQESTGETSSPAGQTGAMATPTLETSWCCLKPQFSIGGGISLLGPGISSDDGCHIRTAPLPQGQEFEDAEFRFLRQLPQVTANPSKALTKALVEALVDGHDPMLCWILSSKEADQRNMCPRNLCKDCSHLAGWKAMCRICRQAVCFSHDLRGFKTRVCGYRDLSVEDLIMKEKMLNVAQETLNRKLAQIKTMDRIADYVQKHGTLNEQHQYELAVITELPATDDDDLQEGSVELSEELLPALEQGDDGPTNAFAFLPFKPKPFKQSNGPLNTSQVWRGCASFICPEYRSIGDPRRKCSAAVRKCSECKVNVCPPCWEQTMPCDCSYCTDNVHCPNCFPSFGSEHCKKAEELELQRQEEEARRQKEARMLEEREGANRIAEQVGEFFAEEGGVNTAVAS